MAKKSVGHGSPGHPCGHPWLPCIEHVRVSPLYDLFFEFRSLSSWSRPYCCFWGHMALWKKYSKKNNSSTCTSNTRENGFLFISGARSRYFSSVCSNVLLGEKHILGSLCSLRYWFDHRFGGFYIFIFWEHLRAQVNTWNEAVFSKELLVDFNHIDFVQLLPNQILKLLLNIRFCYVTEQVDR